MKKGIILAVILLSFIIVSCAEHDHPIPESLQQRVDITAEFDNLTRDEAYLKTANELYGGSYYLSTGAFNNLMSILGEIENGSLQGNPIGEVKSPYVAAVILQNLYTRMKKENLQAIQALYPNITFDIDNLSAITDANKLESNYTQIRSALVNFPSSYYKQLADQFKTVVDHQDLITMITKDYAARLLTTSSSASKPSGSDDNVTIDNFNTVVNVATTIADAFSAEVTGIVTDNDTVVSLISDNLYNLTDATKMQLSYNQSLRFFKEIYYPQLADNLSFSQFKSVLTMYINNNGKTNGIQRGDTATGDLGAQVDDGFATKDDTFKGGTNVSIYPVIAKRLYGAPYDPYARTTLNDDYTKQQFLASNNASYVAINNALTFYSELRKFGLKIPYRYQTSVSGHQTIADTISHYLRLDNFTYASFNDNESFKTVMSTMFQPRTEGGKDYPVCQIITEVNAAIDTAAAGFFGNEGDYDFRFLYGENYANDATNTGAGKAMTANNLNKDYCQITLTTVDDKGAITEYPFDNTTGVTKNQIKTTDGNGTETVKVYTSQDNSTGLGALDSTSTGTQPQP